jgi:hypothetical protein
MKAMPIQNFSSSSSAEVAADEQLDHLGIPTTAFGPVFDDFT